MTRRKASEGPIGGWEVGHAPGSTAPRAALPGHDESVCENQAAQGFAAGCCSLQMVQAARKALGAPLQATIVKRGYGLHTGYARRRGFGHNARTVVAVAGRFFDAVEGQGGRAN